MNLSKISVAGPSTLFLVSDERSFPSRAENDIQIQIDVLNVDLVALLKRKTTGLLTQGEEKEFKDKKRKLKELEKKLIEKKNRQKRQNSSDKKEKLNLKKHARKIPN